MRRLDYWVADTLNGPGPSNMVWALKWAGPQKKNWANINGLKLMGLKQINVFFFFRRPDTIHIGPGPITIHPSLFT